MVDREINQADGDYPSFMAWQCRLRKLSMRELGGRPTPGMSAGIYAIGGDDEQARIQFLIVHRASSWRTGELRHIIRKTVDPQQRLSDGLRILAERHYLQSDQFDTALTALFGYDSNIAEALIDAGACQLRFAEKSIAYRFDFDIRELDQADERFQATYWHNHLFNPALPGTIRILAFSPRSG